MPYQEALERITKTLTQEEYGEFNASLQAHPLNKSEDLFKREAAIWQTLYRLNPSKFYLAVFPQVKKNLFGIPISKTDHESQVYACAHRVAATSANFVLEPNLANMSKAWKILVQACVFARDGEKKYLSKKGHSLNDPEYQTLKKTRETFEEEARQTFYNIIKIRGEQFNDLIEIYEGDPDISRRDKRIQKYLFKDANVNVFKKLSNKVSKLSEQQAKAVAKQETQEYKKAEESIKKVEEQAKQVLKQRVAGEYKNSGSIVNNIVNTAKHKLVRAGIETAIKNKVVDVPYLEQLKQEQNEILLMDFNYIKQCDDLFGVSPDIFAINPSTPGTVLDRENINVSDISIKNILATAQHVASTNIKEKVAKSPVLERSTRAARIIGATIIVGSILLSISLSIIFPPIIPAIIAANAFVIAAVVSFLYFNRDPIPFITNKSQNILERFYNTLINVFYKKPKPTFSNEIDLETKLFLQSLDPKIANQLQKHFQERSDKLQQQITEAIASNNLSELKTLEKDLLKIQEDWDKLIVAATKAAKNPSQENKQQFCNYVELYLKEAYINITRPELLKIAMARKQQHDSMVIDDTLTQSEKLAHKKTFANLSELPEAKAKIAPLTTLREITTKIKNQSSTASTSVHKSNVLGKFKKKLGF